MREMTVYVVDDDAEVRECMEALLRSIGLAVRAFSSAHEFLTSLERNQPGCLLLDVRMPDMSGLMLQDKLLAAGMDIPTVFLSGYADVAVAVSAMKKGACDFLLKPFGGQQLLDSVQRALERARRQEKRKAELADLATRFASLSAREREVLEQVRHKRPPKLIACEMGLSRKTVDTHLAAIRRKLGIEYTAEVPALLHDMSFQRPVYSL